MLSIFDHGPPPPCPTPFNLAEDVLAAGAATPDRPALLLVRPTGAESWSHARLTAAVRGTGAGLLALGLRPGDRVLMRLGNTVEFPVLFLGAIAAGLVPVPTSAQLTRPEVEAITQVIRPALIAAGDGIALPEAPGCPVLSLPALVALQDRAPCDWDRSDPDRAAYIVFTSGSSGRPRAVLHAHRAIRARRMMWAGWSDGDRPHPARGGVQLDLHPRHRVAGPLGQWRDRTDPRRGRRSGPPAAVAAPL